MACLNMLNNEQHQQQQQPQPQQQPHHSLHNTMGPRISFSSDFGDPQQPIKLDSSYREAPVSSDFAFSVPSYSMISADEVFFKGKMLPLKENCSGRSTTTLKDELLAGDDDDDEYGDVFSRLGKSGGSWKERLGIKRATTCVVSKRSSGSFVNVDEIKGPEGGLCVKFRG